MTEEEIGENKDWDKVEVGNDLYLRPGITTVKFQGDNPVEWVNRWGRRVFKFPVSLNGVDLDLVVSSKRLLQALATHKPIGTKTFQIYRSGEGTDTQYKVEYLEHPEQLKEQLERAGDKLAGT